MSEYIVRETGYPGAVKQEIVGELVRCKWCKNRETELYDDKTTMCYCPFVDRYTTDDWYCADGERKDDE